MMIEIFKKLIKNNDIRSFKENIFYKILFRFIRLYYKKQVVVRLYNFKILCSFLKNEGSHSILKKCRTDNESIFEAIDKIKSKKIIFFDCGANHGVFSLYFASKDKSNRVYSFEASPKTFLKLKKNIILNKIDNIKYFNKAVFSESKKILFFKHDNIDADSKISLNNPTKIKVKTIKLDDFFYKIKNNSNKFQIIIKFDIEGQDINGLKGSLKIIKKYNPIIVFEFSNNYLTNPENKKFLQNFLKKNLYEIYDSRLKKFTLNDLSKILKNNKSKYRTIGDYLLIKKISKKQKK